MSRGPMNSEYVHHQRPSARSRYIAYQELWFNVLMLGMRDAIVSLKEIKEMREENRGWSKVNDFDLHEPIAWINSDNKGVGSMFWICSVLGVSPDKIYEYVYSAAEDQNWSSLKLS